MVFLLPGTEMTLTLKDHVTTSRKTSSQSLMELRNIFALMASSSLVSWDYHPGCVSQAWEWGDSELSQLTSIIMMNEVSILYHMLSWIPQRQDGKSWLLSLSLAGATNSGVAVISDGESSMQGADRHKGESD